MFTVEFSDVGDKKKSWKSQLATVTQKTLLNEVRQRKAIDSMQTRFELEKDGLSGSIKSQNGKTVGTYRVVPDVSAAADAPAKTLGDPLTDEEVEEMDGAVKLDEALKAASVTWAGRMRSHFDIDHLAQSGVLGEEVMAVDVKGIVGPENMDLDKKNAVINILREMPISSTSKRYLFSRWLRLVGAEKNLVPKPADLDQVATWGQD